MKKKLIHILLATVALLMFTACAEKELYNPENIFRSETEESEKTEELTYLEAALGDTPTKTAMSSFDGSYKPLWQEKDRIGIFFDNSSSAVEFRLNKGAGTAIASFSGRGKGTFWTALYPSCDAGSLVGKELGMNLPEKQTYAPDSFGPDSYPMVASTTDGVMQFKNLCSTIKIQLKGHHIVDSIRFTTNDGNISVCGPASVNVDFTDEPSLKMGSGGSGSVTLDVGGVPLDPDKATDFYIVLPAQTYTGGFSLQIFTNTGSMTRSTSATVVLKRSKVHALTPFQVKLDEGIEPSIALEGGNPLLVRSLADMIAVASSVNSQQPIMTTDGHKIDAASASYRLENDIDFSPLCSENTRGWTPIGGEGIIFRGEFDGNGHSITNLYVDTDKRMAGLFGCLFGTVKNLSVSGTVKSTKTDVGIIAGYSDQTARIENCTAYGEVSSSHNDLYSNVGGIVGGQNESTVTGCVNYASVKGSYNIGGISGQSGGELYNCVNYGSVEATGHGGGVGGNLYNGKIYNCANYGEVDGTGDCGGVAGEMFNCAQMFNCLNAGDVYVDEGYIGGLCSHSFGNTGQMISNCVNVGALLTPKSFNGNKGGLVGSAEVVPENCYWLYDPEANLGVRDGVPYGNFENCFGLTKAQINGVESYSEPLYYNSEGIPSINVIDALNNWAYDNRKSSDYWGWGFEEESKWLSLTGQPAEPGQGDVSGVFTVTPTAFSISYEEYEFEVKVIAGMGHELSSMPEWISVSDTRVVQNGGLTTTTYTFKAEANPDYAERTGVIVICNDDRQCVPVNVSQMEKIDQSDIWKIKNFYHRSVGLKFTATWCPYCPSMGEEWDYAKEILGDRFQIAAFHPSSSDLGFSKTDGMESLYRVAEYPTGIVDGRARIHGGSYIKAVTEETANAYGTSSGIEFESTVNGDAVDLQIRLFVHRKGNYKVTALLLEDNIISGQQDERYGYISDFRHDNIVRSAFTEVTGEKFTLTSDNSIVPFRYSATIPAVCKPENLRILVFVERAYDGTTRENRVSGVQYITFLDYYVDNANTAPVGQKAEITFDDGTGTDERYESKDYSSDGKVTQLQSATVGNAINIVFTGDGFADKDQKSFETYAKRAMEAFLAVEPYNSLRDRFNVWSINAVSRNDFIGGNTKFSVRFGDGTYVEGNAEHVFAHVRNNLPWIDLTKTLVTVIVNKAVYAGTCHMWTDNSAISYVPLQTSLTEFDATLRHESAGHGFGKLDDEYSYDGSAPSDWLSSRKEWQTMAYGFWENVDFTDDPETIRWKTFLNDSRYYGQVGIFEGGGTYATGVWRSTENSIMRYNLGHFNAPSREAIYKKIMRFSEGDSWTYDYETFVEFDAKGRREEAAYSYTYNRTYGAPAHKENVPLHPPVLMERR